MASIMIATNPGRGCHRDDETHAPSMIVMGRTDAPTPSRLVQHAMMEISPRIKMPAWLTEPASESRLNAPLDPVSLPLRPMVMAVIPTSSPKERLVTMGMVQPRTMSAMRPEHAQEPHSTARLNP